MQLGKDECGNLNSFSYDKSACREGMINYIIKNYLSYGIFNDTIFAMIEKIKKYWGEIPLIYYIGLIVDPRLKFDALDEWLPIIYNEDQIKIEEIKNEVNSLLYILYNIYKEKYGNNISLIKSSSTTSSSSFYKSPLEMFKSRKKATTSSPNNTTNIDKYLSVETITFEDSEDFDILEWWKKQQIKYLVLSIIARDVLTVPVSKVASEAAFSAGGRVVSKKRCNLSPQAIKAVVCLKDWSLTDKRLHDHVREAGLVADTEQDMNGSKIVPRHQKIMIKIFYWKCILYFYFLMIEKYK